MEKKEEKKMGDPVSAVVIYWLAASTLVGSAWNAFQIWERCKTELRPPEQKEEWDVIMREDSHGRKMIYYPKDQMKKIVRQVIDHRDHRDHRVHRGHRDPDPHADTLESDSSYDSVTVSTSD